MKVEQLPSGSYRVRKMINGQNITKVFDHKPTQKEIAVSLAADIDNIAPKTAFLNCAKKYIESKNSVLSPGVVNLYNDYINSVLPKWFLDMKMNEISQVHIQTVINDYAKDHNPKTVRNLHGFISPVMKMFRPNMVLHTTLPKRIKYEPYIPTTDEIRQVLDMAKGTQYHIPFQLGVLGMRRGEICALTMDDIDGNVVKINKALVYSNDKKWVIKPVPKTEESNREIFIPDALAQEIAETGYIYEGFNNMLIKALHRFQKQLGIQPFRFHDLRHFYASYAHSMGMSDADIMKSGGWKSDHVMKNVYRHAMKESLQGQQARIASGILS
jgi:integrase